MDVTAQGARGGRRPSLQGIEGEHRLVPTGAQVWLPRVLVVLALCQVALNLVAGGRWTVLFWGLAVVVYLLQAHAVRRVRTVLDEDGVKVHNGVTRPRSVPWSDVEGVHVQSRWEAGSRLVRRAGRDVQLPGVPVAAARQLAAQLGATDAPGRDGASDSQTAGNLHSLPVEDIGMEGPFRRRRPPT